MEPTWLAGMPTGPMLSETAALARISSSRTDAPTANRLVTAIRR